MVLASNERGLAVVRWAEGPSFLIRLRYSMNIESSRTYLPNPARRSLFPINVESGGISPYRTELRNNLENIHVHFNAILSSRIFKYLRVKEVHFRKIPYIIENKSRRLKICIDFPQKDY
jgi:hypothetical protein